MKIVLAGGTGFIGARLAARLVQDEHDLILLTRRDHSTSVSPRIKSVRWDPAVEGGWQDSLKGADAVINLSGENISAKRWSLEQKNKIIQSRIVSVAALRRAIGGLAKKPAIFVNASAVGYYGDAVDEVTEDSPAGTGFLADTCRAWEHEVDKLNEGVSRVVKIRFGVVLGKDGGALPKMLPPFKLFIGGPLGSGKQWFPWIHIDDAAGILVFAVTQNSLEGAVNAVAPECLTLGEFCQVLGRVLKRPSLFNVPAFILKMLLGEMSTLLLSGQKAIPQKVLREGYVFRFPDAESALKNLL